MTFLLELYNARQACSNANMRFALSCAYAKVRNAMDAFSNNPTDDTLRHLNGVWISAHRLLANVAPEPVPTGPQRAAAA